MRTIKIQLDEIKNLSSSLVEITDNFKMGLITDAEYHVQLRVVLDTIYDVRQQIIQEYGINDAAIDLLLIVTD